MKIKAACIGTPDSVPAALSGSAFASRVLSAVVGGNLGVKDVLSRPAEYYVQKADVGPSPKEGMMGVEVRLTGATRAGRETKQFHRAVDVLLKIVAEVVGEALDKGEKCQVFCAIMIDGDVESKKGSAQYSTVIESDAIWVGGEREAGFHTRPTEQPQTAS